LIEKGSHRDACDNDLLTALHWSAKDGHLSILELLLQKKANTELKSKDGNTALHIAAELNFTNIVAALIDYKANVNAKNGDGKSPIEVAISKGHIEIVCQLQDAGARIGDNGEETLCLLCLAAEAGQVALIKSTLDKVDEDEKKNYMNATSHEASRHGQVHVITYLLDNGAEIESLNDDGLTPLFLAGQYPDVISTLIHRGACINARNQKRPHQGVLHYYASLNQIEGVRLLLNCDYNIHIRDNDYRTALHYVARERNGDSEIADILLRQGVDVNAKDREGHTALHYCSGHESLDLANLLIGFGIDIDAKARFSKSTALHLAINCRNLKLISLLVRHRADVNARDDSETVLHTAVQENLTAECALLIESGANVNSRDRKVETPLAKALINHNPSLVKLLLEHGASVQAFRESDYMVPRIMSNISVYGKDYNLFRRFLDVVNLFVKAGADCSGLEEAIAKLKMENPIMRKLLTEPSYQQLKLKDNMTSRSSIAYETDIDIAGMNDYRDEARMTLIELISSNINVYEGKFSFFINMHRFFLCRHFNCFHGLLPKWTHAAKRNWKKQSTSMVQASRVLSVFNWMTFRLSEIKQPTVSH
jgi:ankyrin repeat protein